MASPDANQSTTSPAVYRRDQRITLDGGVFVLVTFAVGFAAYNTGTSLLYLILSLMLAFLILSGLMAGQLLRGVTVGRRVPGRVFAKEQTPITLTVANDKRWLASYSLLIRDDLAGPMASTGGVAYVFQLPARRDVETNYTVAFPRRGWVEATSIRVETRYPFGFFERRKTLPITERVLVYPAVVDLIGEPVLIPGWTGDRPATARGTGHDLLSMREYVPGESARDILWKHSARTGALIVAERARDLDPRLHLAINTHWTEAMDTPAHRASFEQAMTLVASLALWTARQNDTLGLWLPDGSVTMRGPADVDRLLRVLAEAKPQIGDGGRPRRAPVYACQVMIGSEQRLTRWMWPTTDWQTLLRRASRYASTEAPAPESTPAVPVDERAA